MVLKKARESTKKTNWQAAFFHFLLTATSPRNLFIIL